MESLLSDGRGHRSGHRDNTHQEGMFHQEILVLFLQESKGLRLSTTSRERWGSGGEDSLHGSSKTKSLGKEFEIILYKHLFLTENFLFHFFIFFYSFFIYTYQRSQHPRLTRSTCYFSKKEGIAAIDQLTQGIGAPAGNKTDQRIVKKLSQRLKFNKIMIWLRT